MSDHPFYEVAKTFAEAVARGDTCHQKFTCANCGTRQTMAEPNLFYKTGKCEECGHITDIEKAGCNFMLLTKRWSF